MLECHGKNRRNKSKSTKTPAPTRRTPQPRDKAPETADRGRLNHFIEEDVRYAPEVVIGEFLVNATKAWVLFNSRATRSYIFSKFVAEQLITSDSTEMEGNCHNLTSWGYQKRRDLQVSAEVRWNRGDTRNGFVNKAQRNYLILTKTCAFGAPL